MLVTVNTIETEQDYERALKELEALVDSDHPSGTEAAARLEVLGLIVEAYEEAHYPIPPPDPIAAIRFRIDQGTDEAVLADIMGSEAMVREVLEGRQELTLPMIRRLHKELGIPAESLIGGG